MLIDSHCHLPSIKNLDKTRLIVHEAGLEGVQKLINIGTSVSESLDAIAIAKEFPNVYASVGIYPHENLETPVEDLISSLRQLISDNPGKVVGIGECGIDKTEWPGGRSLDQQEKLFEAQIKLSIETKLPLIVHNRNGDETVARLLKKYVDSDLTGVAHCFASDQEMAQTYINNNFYLSFSAMITYPSRKELAAIAKSVPNDRFLLETDAPYLPPQSLRGSTNHPKYVKIVALKVAELKGLTLEDTAFFSYRNTENLFKLC